MTEVFWFLAGVVVGQIVLALALLVTSGPARDDGEDSDEHA